MEDSPIKNPKLTDRQNLFVQYLFEEENLGDLVQAAKRAGYARVPEITGDMKEEILTRANNLIAANSPKAVGKLIGTMEGKEGDGVILKAATELLDRAGLTKVEKVKVEGENNYLVVLPAKKPVE